MTTTKLEFEASDNLIGADLHGEFYNPKNKTEYPFAEPASLPTQQFNDSYINAIISDWTVDSLLYTLYNTDLI